MNPASPWSAGGFATPMVGGISRLIKLGQERLLTAKKFRLSNHLNKFSGEDSPCVPKWCTVLVFSLCLTKLVSSSVSSSSSARPSQEAHQLSLLKKLVSSLLFVKLLNSFSSPSPSARLQALQLVIKLSSSSSSSPTRLEALPLAFKLFKLLSSSSSSSARLQAPQPVFKLLSSSSSSSARLQALPITATISSSSYQLIPRLRNSSTSSPSGSSSIDCIVHLSRRPARLDLQQTTRFVQLVSLPRFIQLIAHLPARHLPADLPPTMA
ncbi:Armadillo-type fold [Arabidopsis thaliana x Arabidopsis arenosa]|uniref:Armadillo-type fold n=1 Tax=Arabidopsis thaliana x Arabidopsis arenosa TaxID=1240361 RepID=A0A8T2E464_9BRAS|nr:Armadillo-type fold [Arabidopsis thaliana x Arabidopsis arenosa]